MKTINFIFLITLVIGLCPIIHAEQIPSNSDFVRQYTDNYNQKDLSAMTAKMANNIKWMSINSDKISIETHDKAQLTQAMQSYFASSNATTSELIQVIANGSFVSTVEKASWESHGEIKSQCSVATYEVINLKIKNVWYHSAQPCSD